MSWRYPRLVLKDLQVIGEGLVRAIPNSFPQLCQDHLTTADKIKVIESGNRNFDNPYPKESLRES
jgi:protein involved in ribonucleotide reduction